ncbi:hypothetical protein K438DRAFT_1942857 [Mycena galopus ATCC 62051]|nr:hypothetical protein K438DRAFT_1942857 [Mycena galopus ATCC 62051]
MLQDLKTCMETAQDLGLLPPQDLKTSMGNYSSPQDFKIHNDTRSHRCRGKASGADGFLTSKKGIAWLAEFCSKIACMPRGSSGLLATTRRRPGPREGDTELSHQVSNKSSSSLHERIPSRSFPSLYSTFGVGIAIYDIDAVRSNNLPRIQSVNAPHRNYVRIAVY